MSSRLSASLSRSYPARTSTLWLLAGAAVLCLSSTAFAQTRMTNPAPRSAAVNRPPQLVRVPPSAVIDRRGMGGTIYGTGYEPVSIRIIPKRPSPEDATYRSRIFVVFGGRTNYVGHNRENKTVPLGKVPAGEIQILIATDSEGVTSTGPASRNSDQLPHAVARDLADGLVDVRFEGSLGLPEEKLVYGGAVEQEYARKNYFGDVLLQLSGGVTTDATVPTLLEELQSNNAERRNVAAEALRQTHPRIARAAGLFGGRATRSVTPAPLKAP